MKFYTFLCLQNCPTKDDSFRIIRFVVDTYDFSKSTFEALQVEFITNFIQTLNTLVYFNFNDDDLLF